MTSTWLAAAIGAVAGAAALAQAPVVRDLTPSGAQPGTTVTVELRGAELGNALGLWFPEPGIEVLGIDSKAADRCTAQLRVAADCAFGMRTFRLHTVRGLGNVVTFRVVPYPVLQRPAGAEPMVVEPGCTVEAVLRAAQTHDYEVMLDRDSLLTCEVEAYRLGRGPVDLALGIRTADGREIGSADDSALGIKDPIWSQPVAAGRYRVRVQTAYFDNNNAGRYWLHIGTAPRPAGALVDASGRRAQLIGAGDRQIALPDDFDGNHGLVAVQPASFDGFAPSPIVLRCGGPPLQTPTPDERNRGFVTLPAAVQGVLAEPGQVAQFWFRGSKGQDLEFLGLARTLRSPLDPVLTLRREDGGFLAANDDAFGVDALLRFTLPADGVYQVELRDLLRRGSPIHFYRVEAGPRSGRGELRLLASREQPPVVTVPAGAAGGAVLLAESVALGPDRTLLLDGLPDGLTVEFGRVPAGSRQTPFVIRAPAEQPRQAAGGTFRLREGDAAEQPLPYLQDIALVTSRNEQPVLRTLERRLPVAVVAPATVSLTLAAPTAPLVRGAALQVPVGVARNGLRERVQVRCLWLPPGVTAGPVLVPPESEQAIVQLDANDGAPIGTFSLAVVATWRSGSGVDEVATTFVPVEVIAPLLNVTAGRARTVPGRPAELELALARNGAATGPVTATLLGLPRGVTAAPLQLGDGDAPLRFQLEVGADAPPGRHRALRVELQVPIGSASALHRFAAGELRIDPPRRAAGGGRP